MIQLLKKIEQLRKSVISSTINKRLMEFKELGEKSDDDWFCELCFCLLTANSKAMTALNIQQELGPKGFLCKTQDSICECIRKNKHRFHNNKSKFIVQARKSKNIKQILSGQEKPREWLVKNIKGLGMKEASHFLRNVGYHDFAIVDRHIINLLSEYKIIVKPKTMSRKIYIDIEDKLAAICEKVNMTQSELDLYLWYMKTGKVLK